MSTIDQCKILDLQKIASRRGNITPVGGMDDISFDIERIYYLFDVPGGSTRGGHAHKALEQVLVAVMGALDVVLDDGERKKTIRLDRAYKGLYIPRLIWRELENFSSGGICLVLASLPYDESDYYRDYREFLKAVEATNR